MADDSTGRGVLTKSDLEEEITRLANIAGLIKGVQVRPVKVTRLRGFDDDGVNWDVGFHEDGDAGALIRQAIEVVRKNFNLA